MVVREQIKAIRVCWFIWRLPNSLQPGLLGSALAQWYVERTSGTKRARKTTVIVALARKLLIALWRLATTGVVPEGVVLRSAG